MITIDNREVATLLLDLAPVGVYWTREDGKFVWVNQSACEMLGYTREELLALDIFSVDASMTQKFWQHNWDDTKLRGEGRLERIHRRKDNSLVPVEIIIRTATLHEQSMHLAFVRDLSEQKNKEALESTHTQFLKSLFQDSPQPQLILDPDTMKIIDANSAAERFYGYEPIRGLSISTITKQTPEDIQQQISEAKNNQTTFFHFRHRIASGEVRNVRIHSGPIERDGRILLHSSIEDVTALHEIQHELKAHHDQLERLPLGVFRTTPGDAGVIVSVNNAMCDILEVASKADLIGKNASDFYPNPSDRAMISNHALAETQVEDLEIELITGKGNRIFVSLSLYRQENNDGDIFFDGVLEDITERYKHQQKAQQAEAIIENAAEGITITGPDRKIQRVNPAFTRITGYTMEEVVGRNPRILSSGVQDSNFYYQMWRQIDDTGSWKGGIWNRRKNGEVYPEILSISAICDKEGVVTNYAAIFSDRTEIKNYQSEIKQITTTDNLTGLSNAESFLDLVSDEMTKQKNYNCSFPIFVFGVDRFGHINAIFGNDIGDRVLSKIGYRLQVIMEQVGSVARIGGDKFALLPTHKNNKYDIDYILSLLQSVLDHREISNIIGLNKLSFSTGVAEFPTDAITPSELMYSAEMAMFEAKKTHPGNHLFFNESIMKPHLLEAELANALKVDKIDIVFQPIVSIANNNIIGVESLARWKHPEKGYISPEIFIPIAENAGLIEELSVTLLAKAAAALVRISNQCDSHLRLSFNISPKHINQKNFQEDITKTVTESGMSLDHLEIEVTESTLMQHTRQTSGALELFREKGISISIDDFGTGYSSLAYLHDIKAQTLKIDKRFIDDCVDNIISTKLVSSIISMAHALEMKVIAEGVENNQQLELLKSLGCDYYQGYLFSKPIPVEQFCDLVMASKITGS